VAAYGSPADEPGEAQDKAPEVELPSLATRISWFDDWEEQTREARNLSVRDRDYYDNWQWTDDELRVLRERKQPALVKNYIARKVNFVRGEGVRRRIDPVARPRTPQHEDSARAATDALRYVKDEQGFDQVQSAVIANMLIEGFGGAEKSIERDEEGDVTHKLTHIQWDRLFYDPHSRCPDFSDAKYLGIVMWMDLDDAYAAWPDAREAIENALSRDIGSMTDTTDDKPKQWSDKKRKRVKIVQMYFRVGDDWYRADFTQGADLLKPEQTAYLDEKGKHSVCPLILASCYVDQDGMRYGLVRALISPQDEVNKRASKALHLLNTKQTLSEEGAIPDPHKFSSEIAKPDGGYHNLRPGALRDGSIEIMQTGDLTAGHVSMMEGAKADINSIGPSSATLPDIPNGASGRAFQARQQAANQELGTFFDSVDDWTMRVFELNWLCIRWNWTEEKWLRVSDDQELTGYRFVALNQQMPRAQRLQELLEKGAPFQSALQAAAGELAPYVMQQVQMQLQQMGANQDQEQAQQAAQQLVMRHPLMQQPVTVNQVDRMLVDIVMDKAPDTAILAQEEFATLGELGTTLLQANPAMAPMWAKLLVQASQLPNKRELLEAMDKPPDPQQAQMQQAQQQLQMQGAQAGIAVQQSQAQLNQAKAQSEQAKAHVTVESAPSEIAANQAGALHDAAIAGSRTGGM
jgi:hypothetical protein